MNSHVPALKSLKQLEAPYSTTKEDSGPLFIAIPVPYKAKKHLFSSVREYSEYIENIIPESNWYITLVELGNADIQGKYMQDLKKDLPQPYLPTVSISHVGRGVSEDQLWAYVHRTGNLVTLKESLMSRLKSIDFPLPENKDHKNPSYINLAHLSEKGKNRVMADYPVNTTWTVKESIVYRSISTPSGIHCEPLFSIPFVK